MKTELDFNFFKLANPVPQRVRPLFTEAAKACAFVLATCLTCSVVHDFQTHRAARESVQAITHDYELNAVALTHARSRTSDPAKVKSLNKTLERIYSIEACLYHIRPSDRAMIEVRNCEVSGGAA